MVMSEPMADVYKALDDLTKALAEIPAGAALGRHLEAFRTALEQVRGDGVGPVAAQRIPGVKTRSKDELRRDLRPPAKPNRRGR